MKLAHGRLVMGRVETVTLMTGDQSLHLTVESGPYEGEFHLTLPSGHTLEMEGWFHRLEGPLQLRITKS